MRFPAALSCLFLLTGCMSSLDYLKFGAPEADDFNSALAAEYMAYAESELDQGRPESAEYFAAKGLKALHGGDVVPEIVSPELPEEIYKRHTDAREMLMAILTDDMKSVAAQKLARAELLFDCWQKQSAMPGQEIAPCYDEFQSAMDDLMTVAETFIHGGKSEHYIQFPEKSAMPNEQSVQIIQDIVNRASGMSRYTITLEAFPANTSVSQRKLSENRLSAVRSAFVSLNIPDERIETEKPHPDKTVYLSRDEMSEHRNSVKVVTKGFGRAGSK